MGEHLKRELENYYRTESGDFIFRNGMSLNQLAIEMSIDAGTLSRVRTGKRPFTAWQIDAFCWALRLSPRERWALQQARHADELTDDAVTIEPSLYASAVLDGYPKKILNAWRAGYPQLSSELAREGLDRIRELLEKFPKLEDSADFGKRTGRLLYEEARAYRAVSKAENVVAFNKLYMDKIEELAKRHKDKELYGLQYLSEADAYYIEGKDYNNSIKHAKEALEILESIDDRLYALGLLSLAGGYQDERGEVLIAKRAVRQIIRDELYSDEIEVCQTLEGIAGGLGLIKSSESLEHLHEARQLITQLARENIRTDFPRIQCGRTGLIILGSLKTTDVSVQQLLLAEAEEGYKIAERATFTRHATHLRVLLDK